MFYAQFRESDRKRVRFQLNERLAPVLQLFDATSVELLVSPQGSLLCWNGGARLIAFLPVPHHEPLRCLYHKGRLRSVQRLDSLHISHPQVRLGFASAGDGWYSVASDTALAERVAGLLELPVAGLCACVPEKELVHREGPYRQTWSVLSSWASRLSHSVLMPSLTSCERRDGWYLFRYNDVWVATDSHCWDFLRTLHHERFPRPNDFDLYKLYELKELGGVYGMFSLSSAEFLQLAKSGVTELPDEFLERVVFERDGRPIRSEFQRLCSWGGFRYRQRVDLTGWLAFETVARRMEVSCVWLMPFAAKSLEPTGYPNPANRLEVQLAPVAVEGLYTDERYGGSLIMVLPLRNRWSWDVWLQTLPYRIIKLAKRFSLTER